MLRVTLKQITDGTSKTGCWGRFVLALMKATPADPGLSVMQAAICWLIMGGAVTIAVRTGAAQPRMTLPLGTANYAGATAGCCGVHGWQSWCSFDQQTARSTHSGGVFIAMCDGSVQFISNDIETCGRNSQQCCNAWDQLWLSQDDGYVPPPGRP